MMTTLPLLQSVFGWVYFLAWSATFWPQVMLIFKRGTTAGLSTDFAAINIVGFISYFIFTYTSYYVPGVWASYVSATGLPPQVELVDVLFASHGAVMCTVLAIQLFYYPPRTPPKPYVVVGCAAVQMVVFVGLLTAAFGALDWHGYLRLTGNVKVLSSVIKHFPQVFLNRQRNSTVGWSFSMVLLDVVGGSFSILQQTARSISQGNWAPFTSNWAKTFLAAEAMAFDFYFIAQHTLFYTDRRDIDLDLQRKPTSDDEEQRDERAPVLERVQGW